MKIKVLILESDSNYLQRISALLSTKYYEELDIYSFDNYEKALVGLKENDADVFLASENFNVVRKNVPGKCAFAYLSESPTETFKDHKAIFKYTKVNDLYESIKKVYSEYEYIPEPEVETKTILFTSPGGGTGSSTAAASCAVHFAAEDKKVLYVNFEKLTSEKNFFAAESNLKVTDIVSLINSNSSNISSKIEEAAAEDTEKVFVLSQGKLDEFSKLGAENFIAVVNTLKGLKKYHYLVIDSEFGLSKDYLDYYHTADKLVFVSDGSEISNAKLLTAVQYISDTKQELSEKTSVLYNRFGGSSTIPESGNLNNIGGIPEFDFGSIKETIMQISGMGVFDILA